MKQDVPVPIAHRPLHAILMEKPDVEPNRRVERSMLMQAEPRQVAVESLAVGRSGEIAVGQPPVGNRAAYAIDELPNPLFAFRCADLAVEILISHHVRGQLAPGDGHLAIVLLEDDIATLPLDGSHSQLPIRRIEWIGHINRAKRSRDRQSFGGRGFDVCFFSEIGRHDRIAHGVVYQLFHDGIPYPLGFDKTDPSTLYIVPHDKTATIYSRDRPSLTIS